MATTAINQPTGLETIKNKTPTANAAKANALTILDLARPLQRSQNFPLETAFVFSMMGWFDSVTCLISSEGLLSWFDNKAKGADSCIGNTAFFCPIFIAVFRMLGSNGNIK